MSRRFPRRKAVGMDQIPQEWRTLGTEPPAGEPAATSPAHRRGPFLPWLIAGCLLLCGVVAALAVAVSAWSAGSSEVVLQNAQIGVRGLDVLRPPESPRGIASASVEGPAPVDIVVDVEGAVLRPGLHVLAAGARVGDAIGAAGGFSSQVDAGAAAQALNLAAPVSDGAKVHVPALGEGGSVGGGVASTPGAGSTGGSTGLIDLNTADQAALESLPGIGPVTATEIIGARASAPFSSVDELSSRRILGPATFEQVRSLVTVGG